MVCIRFSAQPRADGDEAGRVTRVAVARGRVSVLNREPMGMKPTLPDVPNRRGNSFQCSTASRWG